MKTLGIIGGMGPLASCDLLKKIILNTAAGCDQEHIPVLLDSNTAIPDRTAAILSGGASPIPELCKSAKRLEAAGADVLCMSCNTAHYFYDDVAAAVSVPVLHMPRLTAAYTEEAHIHRAALLATDGTIQSGVYQKEFHNTELIVPDPEGQAAVMAMIYDGVKGGNAAFDTSAVKKTLQRLSEQGAEAFILGCTELPIAFEQYHLPGKTIDPTLVLARAAIQFCGAKQKN